MGKRILVSLGLRGESLPALSTVEDGSEGWSKFGPVIPDYFAQRVQGDKKNSTPSHLPPYTCSGQAGAALCNGSTVRRER
jgi:hypothetical protein